MTETIAKGQIKLFDDDDDDFAVEFTEIGGPGGDAEVDAERTERLGAHGPEHEVTPVTATVASNAVVPSTHHLVVGMGTLAAMSEEEFAAKLDVMQRGQDRIRTIQDKLLIQGEDYGKVKGIDRPFLLQPGAEKLANFYGFAVRQEAERLIGDAITSPPLAYHVKSFVHLGDFDGPVIAQGYGEASSWEEKHRWRWAKATCPKCGREGLIKGKADGKLKGKWWCPQREGGCNSTFEPAATKDDGSPLVAPPQKIENLDPWSLAETLIQMASKRSLVASIRRATGTSGLFTQDPDSPSVRQQSDESGGDDNREATVSNAAEHSPVGRGAQTEEVTPAQLARLVSMSRERDLGAAGIAGLLLRLFDLTVDDNSVAVSHAVKALSATQMGQLLMTIETGEVPDPPKPASSAGSSSNRSGANTGKIATRARDDDKSIILEADGMPV